MHKKKVVKQNDQVKLVLEPGLMAGGFRIEDLIQEMRLQVGAMGLSAGTLLIQKLIECEVQHLVGERYERDEKKHYVWGKQAGGVMLGGQKVRIEHDRVRRHRGKGGEVELESYRRFQQDDERTRRVFANLLASVSCRQYGKALETVQEGYGISKSVVSREIVQATEDQLEELTNRRLEDVDLLVLVIDGIMVDETVFIAALGVDRQGKKHLLGFREGGTENADVCVALMENLQERGLRMDRPVLVVMDGSKALRAAVKRFFGKRALIQRCQEHKIRNVLSHLTKKYHRDIEQKLRRAYKMKNHDDALEAIGEVLHTLERISDSAAASLREGLEETLTVNRLELPDILRKTFSTTNTLESAYSRYRHITRNVKRWRNDRQKMRWTAMAFLEAERSFRTIKGYRSLPVLIANLEALVNKEMEHNEAA